MTKMQKTETKVAYYETCTGCGKPFKVGAKSTVQKCYKCRELLAEEKRMKKDIEAEEKVKQKLSFIVGATVVSITPCGSGTYMDA